MNAIVKSAPEITPVDRFNLTLCLAIIFHGIVILGVTFKPEEAVQPRYETMEIILVQQESEPVEDTEFLSQANLEGGGDVEEKVSPSSPVPAPFPDQQPEITASPEPQPETQQAEPVPEPVEEVVEDKPQPENVQEMLTAEAEEASMTSAEATEEPEQPPQPVETEVPAKPEPVETAKKELPEEQVEKPPVPDATTLLTNSFKIASLSAEIRRKLEKKANRPRRKFISASTREYKYAAYMEAWRAKVERVGNLNYPEAARKQKLTGSLILDVALNADGSVNQITIRRSSGSKILDDAAIRIVELSSPFAQFPPHIREETDILHITRTWQFLNNNRFR